MCQGLSSRRHIEKREDPGDEVGLRMGEFFCVLQELIFAIGRNWFFLLFFLGIIFWSFSGSRLLFGIYNILEYKQSNTGEQHADAQHVNHVNQLINGVPLDDPLNCNFVVLFLSDSVFFLISFFSELKS